MSPSKGNKERKRDQLGRYRPRDASVTKQKTEARRPPPVNPVEKENILAWFLQVFFLPGSKGPDFPDFVLANCKHGPLREIYESCIRPKCRVRVHKYAKMLRERYDGPGFRSVDVPRMYVSERSKASRLQVGVFQGKRLPNPAIETERSTVEQFLKDRLEDGSLKWDTVDEAWDAIKTILEGYGKIEGTKEMGYSGYPKKGKQRKKSECHCNRGSSDVGGNSGPVIGSTRTPSISVSPQDASNARGRFGIGNSSCMNTFTQAAVREHGVSLGEVTGTGHTRAPTVGDRVCEAEVRLDFAEGGRHVYLGCQGNGDRSNPNDFQKIGVGSSSDHISAMSHSPDRETVDQLTTVEQSPAANDNLAGAAHLYGGYSSYLEVSNEEQILSTDEDAQDNQHLFDSSMLYAEPETDYVDIHGNLITISTTPVATPQQELRLPATPRIPVAPASHDMHPYRLPNAVNSSDSPRSNQDKSPGADIQNFDFDRFFQETDTSPVDELSEADDAPPLHERTAHDGPRYVPGYASNTGNIL